MSQFSFKRVIITLLIELVFGVCCHNKMQWYTWRAYSSLWSIVSPLKILVYCSGTIQTCPYSVPSFSLLMLALPIDASWLVPLCSSDFDRSMGQGKAVGEREMWIFPARMEKRIVCGGLEQWRLFPWFLTVPEADDQTWAVMVCGETRTWNPQPHKKFPKFQVQAWQGNSGESLKYVNYDLYMLVGVEEEEIIYPSRFFGLV